MYTKKHKKVRIKNSLAQFFSLVIPALICIAILIIIILKYLYPLAILNFCEIKQPTINLVSEQTEISLLLSIVGIAISVWIGLNIYEVVAQKDLEGLIDRTENLLNRAEHISTEILVSKLRISYKDRSAQYFSEQFEFCDILDQDVLKDLISIEDTYTVAYFSYSHSVFSESYEKGRSIAKDLIAKTIQLKQKKLITSMQYELLLSYANLRFADFSYFSVQYGEKLSKPDLKNKVFDIIHSYTAVLKMQFNIHSCDQFGDCYAYTETERQCLAFIANSIGSIYLLYPAYFYPNNHLDQVVKYQLVAKNFSTSYNPECRALFIRNLGVAYERQGDLDKAFKEYCLSYKLNPLNIKTSHCLGSLYRRKIHRTYPFVSEDLKIEYLKINSLTSLDKNIIQDLLKKSLYWYSNEFRLGGKLMDKWIGKIYNFLFVLSREEIYIHKRNELHTQKDYLNEVLDGADEKLDQAIISPPKYNSPIAPNKN